MRVPSGALDCDTSGRAPGQRSVSPEMHTPHQDYSNMEFRIKWFSVLVAPDQHTVSGRDGRCSVGLVWSWAAL